MDNILYEYADTENKKNKPNGEGWEYWGDRKTPDEDVAVWRREEGKYEETQTN